MEEALDLSFDRLLMMIISTFMWMTGVALLGGIVSVDEPGSTSLNIMEN